MVEDPNKIDPNALHNPSSGMLVRNPTHVEIAERAEDQREIVNAIKDAKAAWQKAIYDYSDRGRIPGLPGVLKIREMNEPNMLGFCMTLMRTKPNITGIHLKLGEYPSARPYSGTRVVRLQSIKPRNPTEVAEDMAALLADKSLHVVEMEYKVNSATPGNFSATATAKVANSDEYANDELFKPVLEIEYFSLM